MNHAPIISKLNDPAATIEFSESEISSAVQAGLDLFQRISREVFENIDVENIANSPNSRDFLAHKGGILLWQHDGASIIAQIGTPYDIEKSLLWTPRNILSVVIRGQVQFELFDLNQVCDNNEFRTGVALSLTQKVIVGPGSGFFQPYSRVMRALPAAGTNETVIISFFGKPRGSLDWIFDEGGISSSATLANQQDSDLNQMIQSFLEIQAWAPDEVIVPTEAARILSHHECYLVRWSAMQLLWQDGSQDEEVLERVRMDSHPEIAGRYGELSEMLQNAE